MSEPHDAGVAPATPKRRRFTIEKLEERVTPSCMGMMCTPSHTTHHHNFGGLQFQFQNQMQSQMQSQSQSQLLSLSISIHTSTSSFTMTSGTGGFTMTMVV